MKDLFSFLKQLQAKSSSKTIRRYFALEEAVESLPWVRLHLAKAIEELDDLHDHLMLSKRLYALQYAERMDQQAELEKLLNNKMHTFETALENWIKRFEDKGYLLRDVEAGVVEFPYKAQDGETLFLCWQESEEGILYFREVDEPFSFRKPITLLPI